MSIPSGTLNRGFARGLTLVELIVSIMVLAAGVAGVLLTLNVAVRGSADPLIQKQALAIAESLLEEIQLMPYTYCDPDDPGAATANLSSGAIAFSAATTGGGTGSTINVTHTISGANRYVFVQVVNSNSWPSITSVVWDPTGVNEPLSLIAQRAHASDVRNSLYGLVNPTAKTATMRVTLSGTDSSGTFVAVTSFTGVHQTTPLGTPASSNAVSGTPSVTVSAATGDLVFDAMATKETSGNKTPGPGQTERYDGTNGTSNGAGSTEAGAASVVMNWTGGITEEWAMIGVAVKPGLGGCPLLDETIGPEPGETRYSATTPFDNVNDYHGFDSNTAVPSGIRNIDGTLIAGLAGYRATVSVTGQPLGTIGNDALGNPQSLLITVTVTGPGNTSVTLNGYRTRYAPNDLP
jgi:Tfp pilus assembly protein PilV